MTPNTSRSARRILVVDDEPRTREAVALYLQDLGYQVESTGDAQSGLEVVRDGVDLVITDIRMPEMDGIEFLQEIRAAHPGLPVMLITGYPGPEASWDARQLEATAFLSKPFRLETLATHVRMIFGEADPPR
ncbi:MAG TPA: response regulator [Candidatus Methylomirabilis sp.]|jgi:CheY-like chemotaxis protein